MTLPDVSWMDADTAARLACGIAGLGSLSEVTAWTDSDATTAVRALKAIHAPSAAETATMHDRLVSQMLAIATKEEA